MLLLNTRRTLAPAVVLRLPYLKVQNMLQLLDQDTSPSLWSERRDEYLFGLAKTRDLGWVTAKKTKEKIKGPEWDYVFCW